jgi:MoaA/NifB/PqqE/SkfB family radical SAM enzyme
MTVSLCNANIKPINMNDVEIYLSSIPDLCMPNSINLEITNWCNLKCNFCINHEDTFRKKGFMSEELFDALIMQIKPETLITICGIGEPTIHPKFATFLNKLKVFDKVNLVTNGQNLKEDIIKSIVESSISKLSISLDYFDSQEYSNNKHGSLDKVLNGVDLLLQKRNEANSNLILQINMLAEENKEKQIEEAISYFNKKLNKKDFVYTRHIKTLGGLVNIKRMADDNSWLYLEQFRERLSKKVNVEKYQVENWCKYLGIKQQLTKRIVCRHPFYYCMVLWNGRVSACCIDFNGQPILGDLNNNTMSEIWNGARAKQFREDMKKMIFSSYPLCRKCKEWYKCS